MSFPCSLTAQFHVTHLKEKKDIFGLAINRHVILLIAGNFSFLGKIGCIYLLSFFSLQDRIVVCFALLTMAGYLVRKQLIPIV